MSHLDLLWDGTLINTGTYFVYKISVDCPRGNRNSFCQMMLTFMG